MNLEDFIHTLIAEDIEPNDTILNYLCKPNMDRVNKWVLRLRRVRGYRVEGNSNAARKQNARRNDLVGRIYEKLCQELLDGCSKALRYQERVRTTNAEIDFLVCVQPAARMVPFLSAAGTHILGECKCEVTHIKAPWVNKLGGLMDTHGATVAILFTATSPADRVSSQARSALNLHSARGRTIIPFGPRQLAQLESGENFISVLADQYVAVRSNSTALTV